MEGRSSLFSWYQVRALFGVALLLFAALQADASNDRMRVGVVISGDNYYFTLTYQHMVKRVLDELPNTQFVLLTPASLRVHTDQSDFDLLIAIGSEATRTALEHPIDTPLLTTFVTQMMFQQYLEQNIAQQPERRISAIYLDQPVAYRVRLARILTPNAQVLGTALGPLAEQSHTEFLAATTDLDFELLATSIDLDSNPNRELTPVFREADVFVVVPDSAQLNQAASRWILNLGYRNRTPVIGFSQSYTRAGALASLYTAPQDIGRDTAENVVAWLCCRDEKVWQPHYSRYFTIDTNTSVAHVLGMELPSDDELKRAVLDYRETP